jgi:arginyl-tRNA synthetase
VYNAFYQHSSIIRETDETLRNYRMALTMVTGRTLKHAMSLLGIEMPERM